MPYLSRFKNVLVNESGFCLFIKIFLIPQRYLHWKNEVLKNLALGYIYCAFNLG